jgi:hypothetical protein
VPAESAGHLASSFHCDAPRRVALRRARCARRLRPWVGRPRRARYRSPAPPLGGDGFGLLAALAGRLRRGAFSRARCARRPQPLGGDGFSRARCARRPSHLVGTGSAVLAALAGCLGWARSAPHAFRGREALSGWASWACFGLPVAGCRTQGKVAIACRDLVTTEPPFGVVRFPEPGSKAPIGTASETDTENKSRRIESGKPTWPTSPSPANARTGRRFCPVRTTSDSGGVRRRPTT